MNAKKLPIATSLLIVIHAACAQAESSGIPEECFASASDYQNYQSAPKLVSARGNGPVVESGAAPMNMKPITVRLKDSQPSSGATVTLDASESTVPSGQPEFFWTDKLTGVPEKPVKTKAGGSPGSYFNVALTVRDKVCGHSATNKFTIYNK